jgi:uncharacterized membrane protein
METIFKLKEILFSTEGKIFLVGFGLSVVLFFIISYYWLIDFEIYKAIVSVVASDVLLGRMAGISVGLNMNLSTSGVIFLNLLVETIMVFIFYSFFLLSWNKLFKFDLLHNSMEKVKDIAKKYETQINRYGIFGLFAFVLFPFFMTGATIGSVVGFLMGFSHKKTLFVVTSGTFIAILIWTYLIKELQQFLNTLNENGFLYFIGFFILIAVGVFLYKKLSKGNNP